MIEDGAGQHVLTERAKGRSRRYWKPHFEVTQARRCRLLLYLEGLHRISDVQPRICTLC